MAASRSRRCSAAWKSALSSSGLTTVSGFTIFLTITRCLQKRRWTVGDAASATPEGYDWSSTDCKGIPLHKLLPSVLDRVLSQWVGVAELQHRQPQPTTVRAWSAAALSDRDPTGFDRAFSQATPNF